MEKHYTIRDVSDMTGMSEWQVYQEIRSGRLWGFVRRGMERGYRIPASELDRWQREEWVRPTRSPSSR